ncbi:hypothetical protein Sgleb_12640 [Streptomyces glebosus]|uniref:Transposase n=1 Tax=Streptomyces glebosus TaxID=249580 RepID=A0A640SPG7_9ACTN|nr:hypothetical protein Sgleb_12640 [Streptomyces glebosus]GHG66930.1 hypothetical protein GCM10010513_36670 [Streptomyces glebosus]
MAACSTRLAVSAVDPDLAQAGVGRGHLVEQVGAGYRVLDAGRGDQHREQQAERVRDDAPLAAHDLPARVRALTRGRHAGGGLDVLCIDHAGRRARVSALLLAYQLSQKAVGLGEDVVLLPLGEVAVDRVPVREVVRQGAPLLELRRRAVRMVAEVRGDYPNETAALQAVADKLGIGSRETLRNWVKQNEIDAGQRPGTTTQESAQLKVLKKENAELKRANEILYCRAQEN